MSQHRATCAEPLTSACTWPVRYIWSKPAVYECMAQNRASPKKNLWEWGWASIIIFFPFIAAKEALLKRREHRWDTISEKGAQRVHC